MTIGSTDENRKRSFGGSHDDRQASGQGEPHAQILNVKISKNFADSLRAPHQSDARSLPGLPRPCIVCVNPFTAFSQAGELHEAARLRADRGKRGGFEKMVLLENLEFGDNVKFVGSEMH